MSKKEAPVEAPPDAAGTAGAAGASDAPQPPAAGIPRKTWYWIGGITLAVWLFALNTGNTWVLLVVGVLTLALIGAILWALRTIRKHKGTMSLLQGAVASPEARKEALAKLSEGKDAGSPTNVFARSQLLATDDPQAALQLLGTIELRNYPPAAGRSRCRCLSDSDRRRPGRQRPGRG